MKKVIDSICNYLLVVAGLFAITAIVIWLDSRVFGWGACLLSIATVLASLAISCHTTMRTYAFVAWVVCVVVVAIAFPGFFLHIGPIKTVNTLTYLIQIAMFGMGATLTLNDFYRVLRLPKGVFVGMALQFSAMPFLGWAIASALGLPSEIAVGLILVGCCPGGVSSNVITYLAKGNVALSVTMTACSTLISPVMTPLMMYLLAGTSVAIDYVDMFRSILLTVFIPVLAGLLCNFILQKLKLAQASTERYLAIISMIAICAICGIIAANSSAAIQTVGFVLFVAVFLHNTIGYLLGYFGAKVTGMNEADSRTIAIEVGLQNGGMAAMLAATVLKVPATAIAPALFAPVMNVTGSLLAAWWGRETSPSSVDHSLALEKS